MPLGRSCLATSSTNISPQRWTDFKAQHFFDTHAVLIGRYADMHISAWVFLALAAAFEVGGDAVIRVGIKNGNVAVIILGAIGLAGYGIMVNIPDWDFSKILGVYIGVFALSGVLFGRFAFRESVPFTTWLGLGFIVAGALIIESGTNR
jgi:multidrug transporter EmrE-like cation transporter